jgi:hypothetical protein
MNSGRRAADSPFSALTTARQTQTSNGLLDVGVYGAGLFGEHSTVDRAALARIMAISAKTAIIRKARNHAALRAFRPVRFTPTHARGAFDDFDANWTKCERGRRDLDLHSFNERPRPALSQQRDPAVT